MIPILLVVRLSFHPETLHFGVLLTSKMHKLSLHPIGAYKTSATEIELYSNAFRYTHAANLLTYHMKELSQAMIHIEVTLLGPVG